MDEISDGIFVECGFQGVTVGAIVTKDGIIAIDCPSYPRDARNWVAMLEQLHAGPVRYLLLTDYNGDRILSTRWINAPIISQQFTAEKLYNYDKRYPHILIESLVQRNSKYGKEFTSSPVSKPAMSFSEEMNIITLDHNIMLRHVAGPTLGSAWVQVPEVDILFVGDSLSVDTHPALGDMQLMPWIESLETMLANGDCSRTLVPGRGRLGDSRAVEVMVEYLRCIQVKVEDHLKAGSPRQELASLVDEFVVWFPADGLPKGWLRKQILLGLQRAYDQLISINGESIAV